LSAWLSLVYSFVCLKNTLFESDWQGREIGKVVCKDFSKKKDHGMCM
jgi:hypothetical protein